MKIIYLFFAILIIGCNKKADDQKPVEKAAEDPTLQSRNSASELEDSKAKQALALSGSALGKFKLDVPFDGSLMGQPDFSDSAMGKSWMIWYDKKNDPKERLAIWMVYTTYKNSEMKEKVVTEIRTILPGYTTPTGIGIGTVLENLLIAYPSLTEVTQYRNQRNGKDMHIHDAPGSGIAFEVEGTGNAARCRALIVYRKDKPLNTDYIMYLPERGLAGGE